MRLSNMTMLTGKINTYTLLDEQSRGYTSFLFEVGVVRPQFESHKAPVTDYIPIYAYNKNAKKARSIVRKGRLVRCLAHIVVFNKTEIRLVLDDIEAVES